MFPYTSRAFIAALLVFVLFKTSSAQAQGSLTPPGAPAPTFKTLSQVEPRFPISDYQTNLTVPGSYYLVTNIFSGTNQNDGINVRTNIHDITIDLNGFAIINTNGAGPSASPVGVRISEGTNVVIKNGQIIGFDRGVRAEGLFYGIVVDNVHIRNCRRAGVEATGVPSGDASQTIAVRNCIIEGMDGTGEATSISVDGVTLLNCSAVVQNCVIRDMTPAGSGVGSCIDAITCTNTFFDNNLLANAGFGIKTGAGAGTRYFYRNNLTAGITNAFSLQGGVDRGGNF